jgi:hypothetical protein
MNARVAQLVERRVAIAEIAGSSPAACLPPGEIDRPSGRHADVLRLSPWGPTKTDDRLFWLMIGFVYGLGLAWMLA